MKIFKTLGKRGLALFLVLTMCTSLLPATAMAAELEDLSADGLVLICGEEAHSHVEECYTTASKLTCEVEENHVHGAECYVPGEPELVCVEDHEHAEACYVPGEAALSCEKAENHVHGEDCYTVETVLTCGKEEHEHAEACYAAQEPEDDQMTAEPALEAASVREPVEISAAALTEMNGEEGPVSLYYLFAYVSQICWETGDLDYGQYVAELSLVGGDASEVVAFVPEVMQDDPSTPVELTYGQVYYNGQPVDVYAGTKIGELGDEFDQELAANKANRDVFLFLSLPTAELVKNESTGKLEYSGDSNDYRFLGHGGSVASEVTTNTVVNNPAKQSAVTDLVSEWPQDLELTNTDTSSKPVGSGSTWTINSNTGEVTTFKLNVDGKMYSSDANQSTDKCAYEIRWVKFIYTGTDKENGKMYGERYHVDGALFKVVTPGEIIDPTPAREWPVAYKQVAEFEKDQNSKAFSFRMVQTDTGGHEISSDFSPIALTTTVNAVNTDTLLQFVGQRPTDPLAPGYYAIVETLTGTDAAVWQTDKTGNMIRFKVNPDGTINWLDANGNVIENSNQSAGTGNVITNSLKSYTVTYTDGVTDEVVFADQTHPDLKYNTATPAFRGTNSATIPTRAGYAFVGWKSSVEKDSNNSTQAKVYGPSEQLPPVTCNVTYTAVWLADNPAFTINKGVVVTRKGGDSENWSTVSPVDGKVEAQVGDRLVYTITVANTGNVDLTNLVIQDTLTATPKATAEDPNPDGVVRTNLTGTPVLKIGDAAQNGFTFAYDVTKQAFVSSAFNLAQHATATITYTYEVTAADAGKTLNNVATAPDGTPGKPKDPGTNEVEVPKLTISSFEKQLLTSKPDALNGVDLSSVSFAGTNGKIVLPSNADSVTLLYSITVRGDAGAKFRVTDAGATEVKTSTDAPAKLGEECTIPADGSDVVIYVTKTFNQGTDGKFPVLTNTAGIEPGDNSVGPENPSSTATSYIVTVTYTPVDEGGHVQDDVTLYNGTTEQETYVEVVSSTSGYTAPIPESLTARKTGETEETNYAKDTVTVTTDSTTGNVNIAVTYSANVIGRPEDPIPDRYQATVTFRVENGKWATSVDGNDKVNTATAQTLVVDLYTQNVNETTGAITWTPKTIEGNEKSPVVALTTAQIPTGTAYETYGGGTWSVAKNTDGSENTNGTTTPNTSNALPTPIPDTVRGDVTFVLTYSKNITATFLLGYTPEGTDSEGNRLTDVHDTQSGQSPLTVRKPEDPTRSGYSFDGWLKTTQGTDADGNTIWTPTTEKEFTTAQTVDVTADTVYIAKWLDIEPTFDENGVTKTTSNVTGNDSVTLGSSIDYVITIDPENGDTNGYVKHFSIEDKMLVGATATVKVFKADDTEDTSIALEKVEDLKDAQNKVIGKTFTLSKATQAKITVSYTHRVTLGDVSPDGQSIVNEAKVKAWNETEPENPQKDVEKTTPYTALEIVKVISKITEGEGTDKKDVYVRAEDVDVPNTVKMGQTIEWTITVTNNGNVDATDIVLNDVFRITAADGKTSLIGEGENKQKLEWTSTTNPTADSGFTVPAGENKNVVTFTATYTVPSDASFKGATINNIAVAAGESTEGKPGTTLTVKARIDSVKKELVATDEAIKAAVGDAEAYKYAVVGTDNKVMIHSANGVTLLYKITVNGSAGAQYEVTDEDATLVAPKTGIAQDEETGVITGTIADNAAKAEFYVAKHFDVDDIVTGTGDNKDADVVKNVVSVASDNDDTEVPTDDQGKTPTDEVETKVEEYLPTVTDAEKSVVLDKSELNADIQAALEKLEITWPTLDASGKKTVTAEVGKPVTLLYAITLTGGPGSYFSLQEEENTVLVAMEGVQDIVKLPSEPAQYSGQLSEAAGTKEAILYFTKTFIIEKGTASLTNTVKVNDSIDEKFNPTEEVTVKYPVVFDANGGAWGNPVSDYEMGTEAESLTTATIKLGANESVYPINPEPTYSGHEFTGWYTDKECKNPVMGLPLGPTVANLQNRLEDDNVVLYAGWKTQELQYKVRYNFVNEDAAINPVVIDKMAWQKADLDTSIETLIAKHNDGSANVQDGNKYIYWAADTKVNDTVPDDLSAAKLTEDKTVIDLYFYVDNWKHVENGPDSETDGDGIPDKYQALFTFEALEGGKLAEDCPTTLVKTIGKYATNGTVSIKKEDNVVAVPDTYYSMKEWTSDGYAVGTNEQLTGTYLVEGGKTYAFIASFTENTISYSVVRHFIKNGRDVAVDVHDNLTTTASAVGVKELISGLKTGKPAGLTGTDNYTYVEQETTLDGSTPVVGTTNIEKDKTNRIDMYFYVDNWKDTDDGKDSETGGDGIPDKDQAIVHYVALPVFPKANGEVSVTLDVVTFKGTDSETKLAAESEATPNEGYAFAYWTSDANTDTKGSGAVSFEASYAPEVKRGDDLTFYALFLKDVKGTDPKEPEKPGDGIPDDWQAFVEFLSDDESMGKVDRSGVKTYDLYEVKDGKLVETKHAEEISDSSTATSEGTAAFDHWDCTTNTTLTDEQKASAELEVKLANPVAGRTYTYTAYFVPTYTVTYEWAGAPTAASEGVEEEDVPVLPTVAGRYKEGAAYTADTKYNEGYTVNTYDEYGNVNGAYTFSGWTISNGQTPGTMGNGNVTFNGSWTYAPADVAKHNVIYSWSGLPTQTLYDANGNVVVPAYPESITGLVKNQTYAIDTTRPGTVVYTHDQYGNQNARYVLGAWSDPGNGTMGDTDVIVSAAWAGTTLTPNDPIILPPPAPTVPVGPTGPTGPTGGGGTTIIDEEVPLANAVGLNDTDHFAYIIGYEDDTVRPLNDITRAEAVTIFFRLMNDEYRAANWSTENGFSDVNVGNWYNNAVSTCLKAGALEHFAQDAAFMPNKAITRAEFASIAAGFVSEEITGENVGDFKDTEGHWAALYIRKAVEAGWINGVGGNRFAPDETISRAEVMTMVNRMLDRVPDAEHMLETMKVWTDNPVDAWYYEAVQEATNGHEYERDELGITETWTSLAENRDWAALEKEWADNGGALTPVDPAQPVEGESEAEDAEGESEND